MKRSAQVMLVVMAATGVGATSYSLAPSEDCATLQSDPAQYNACRDRRGGTGHGGSSYSSSRSSYGFSSSSSSGGQSGTSSTALAGGTARGGFGASGHAAGGHGGT